MPEGGGEEGYRVVVGLGHSGLACAHWLHARQIPFVVADTRAVPPMLAELRRLCPGVEVVCGPLDGRLLCRAQSLVVSPGLSLQEPAIRKAREQGVAVAGDVELFCQQIQAQPAPRVPIIAVTGSNGKTTVTRLLESMIRLAGVPAWVGGNIGTPVMNLLTDPRPSLCILELSSFQLETTQSLRAQAAVVLNLAQDHMDRYDTFDDYVQAKQRIYTGCRYAVYNRDDARTRPADSRACQSLSFGLGVPPGDEDFGVVHHEGERWLARGTQTLLPASRLKIRGEHNLGNALAALALGQCAGLPLPVMLEALAQFAGLPHRCQYAGIFRGVRWFNDSKATNPAAAQASIESLGRESQGRILLLAGGLSKDADFSVLKPAVQRYVRELLVFGAAAPLLARALADVAPVCQVADMTQAVELAARRACPGDVVLLAPACSSLDMFDSYEQRGEAFLQALEVLVD
ncbi:MAG: UDP-N-acetylmuramoyl-L-alanine--D-glutamate ligase [Kistimonas sp.]|nr:UDP-N-acetylmuramoyl-L-alanine--D-glutamate ligase [Kistimonas sp.]